MTLLKNAIGVVVVSKFGLPLSSLAAEENDDDNRGFFGLTTTRRSRREPPERGAPSMASFLSRRRRELSIDFAYLFLVLKRDVLENWMN